MAYMLLFNCCHCAYYYPEFNFTIVKNIISMEPWTLFGVWYPRVVSFQIEFSLSEVAPVKKCQAVKVRHLESYHFTQIWDFYFFVFIYFFLQLCGWAEVLLSLSGCGGELYFMSINKSDINLTIFFLHLGGYATPPSGLISNVGDYNNHTWITFVMGAQFKWLPGILITFCCNSVYFCKAASHLCQ